MWRLQSRRVKVALAFAASIATSLSVLYATGRRPLDSWTHWRAVRALIQAGNEQCAAKDFDGALAMYEKARMLAGNDDIARVEEADLAIDYVRDLRGSDEGAGAVAAKMIPLLEAGMNGANGERRSRLHAYIAKAMTMLGTARRPDARKAFERAIAEDPEGVDANVLYGFWLLRYDPSDAAFDEARRRFDIAIAHADGDKRTGRDWVREVQIEGLLWLDDRVKRLTATIPVLDAMRRGDERLAPDERRDVINALYGDEPRRVLAVLPTLLSPADQLATWRWLSSGVAHDHTMNLRLNVARIMEDGGDPAGASQLYASLRFDREFEGWEYADEVSKGIARVGGH